MTVEITVLPDPDAVAGAAAQLIGGIVEDAADGMTLGLAGGSTPRATYRILRAMELPWTRVLCWLSDERWVPSDHEESNVRMVQEDLISHVPASFLGPDTSLLSPQLAAAAYQGLLLPALLHDGELAPDVILLGMGDDGHTASLFPGTDALRTDATGFVANWVPIQQSWRLTATTSLLTAGRWIVFMVTGKGKADAVGRVLGKQESLPAQVVSSRGAAVRWLLDEAAAAELP